MDIFYTCLFLFMIGSFCGWCIELLFRRFFSTKRWVNPGFLNGPYLPLYGFGVVAMYGICSIPIDLLWKIVIIVVSMTLIEYITGLIFIKGLKIKLWDYSARWGNLQGIICPLFSAIWGICGVVFLFVIYPLLSTASVWLSVHKNFLFVIGLFYGVFAVDIAISFKLSSRIRKIAKEIKEVVEFETLKQQIESYAKTNKKSYSFLFAFRSDKPLVEHIRATVALTKKRFLSKIVTNKNNEDKDTKVSEDKINK